jgi:predicted ATPase
VGRVICLWTDKLPGDYRDAGDEQLAAAAGGLGLADLAGGLHDPDLLPHTVATCLGLPGQEAGSQADAIVDYLRGRQLVLILDSCEHLIGACAALAEPVLRYAAQVTILATSRQPMNVPGEHAARYRRCRSPDPRPAGAVLAGAVPVGAVLAGAVLAGAGAATRSSCSPSGPRRPRPASPSRRPTAMT